MSSFFVKPNASFTEVLHEIWPIDSFSRQAITEFCRNNNISFTEVFTTMGTPSMKFNAEDYYVVRNFIDRYSTHSD